MQTLRRAPTRHLAALRGMQGLRTSSSQRCFSSSASTGAASAALFASGEAAARETAPRGEGTPSTSLLLRLGNRPGALEEILRVFRVANINLTRIESRPVVGAQHWDLFIDVEESSSTVPLQALAQVDPEVCSSVQLLGKHLVPWFPRRITDLDSVSKILDAGLDLVVSEDHPGFSDSVYRKRRETVVTNASRHREGMPLPIVEYTAEETATWGVVFKELAKRYPVYACREYNKIFNDLQDEGLYSAERVPQLSDLSAWLSSETGFRLKPAGGLLSSRAFLNGLAFKVFHATQYIRHYSKPFFTPEPDVVHELMGHVPMLADPDFAALSQSIGLASLGASDADIKRLSTAYWFSVEFGVVLEDGKRKGFGAGVLSSFEELENACKPDSGARFLAWNPELAAETSYPITSVQPLYFVANSLHEASQSMRLFCENGIRRPFFASFDEERGRIVSVDRAVRREGCPDES